MEKKLNAVNTKAVVVVAVLALMVLFSAAQAFELVSLKEKINTELTGLTVAAPSTTSNTSKATDLQKNLQNLPSMVGGC
jgi:cytochrome c-type biogenesis protein CcmH/NrfG